MTFWYGLCAVLALSLFIYLIVAMLKPEWF